MKSNEIRQQFLDFFSKKQHQVVASSSLVPGNDPTLLFTNAGMVQFKDVFLGQESRNYKRATSSQCCVRAGGKHNDLDNVGYTARHHTFFEMLGNFSFGDYFKRDAIQFAWEFLTQTLKLPANRLWVTVYQEDKEAEAIWLNEMGVDPKRFSRCGEKDNFWSMGDTGPCGPCTEIFYDHGADVAGGPPGSPDADGDRYIEIWNLVFMQYNRSADGKLTPLAKQSVDTGMGLERLAAVLQGVHNNYETDLFMPIIRAAAELAGTNDFKNQSLRVIADHIRSTSFLIIDGVRPSNEGRGYVLRRIMRRAIRHGYKLGIQQAFFFKLVKSLAAVLGSAYPELLSNQSMVEKVIEQEEQQFAKTLNQGMQLLQQVMKTASNKQLDGETVFKLYDTYGFPIDLTADIAREHHFTIDQAGFDQAMERQRNQSKASSQFKVNSSSLPQLDVKTEFLAYKTLNTTAQVKAIIHDNQLVKTLTAGQAGIIILDQSPFYAESGGQVGDTGYLTTEGCVFKINDTQKHANAILHVGEVIEGSIKVDGKLLAQVDEIQRQATMRNHSATHLLHAALQAVLGHHVVQKGSMVTPDYLRLDFSHTQAVTQDELFEIERRVNAQIRANVPVQTDLMSPEAAKKAGAMALFGEKYGDEVRVLTMGEFSKELCGGTHVSRTGDIGLFKITAEMNVAAGVRRIEACAGEAAIAFLAQQEQLLAQLKALFKTNSEQLLSKIEQSLQRNKNLEKTIEQLENQARGQLGESLVSQAKEVFGIKLLVTKLDSLDAKSLRPLLDQLKSRLSHQAVIVLAAVAEGKVSLIAGVSHDLETKVHAGQLIAFLAEQVGGKGGGRADVAQAGGTQAEHLGKALDSVLAYVQKKLT